MDRRIAIALLLIVFIAVSAFGLFMLLSHDGHHSGCPLHAAGQAMCESTLLEHLSIWQSMFASMAVSLGFFVCVFFVMFRTGPQPAFERVRFRLRVEAVGKPTLFQALFSRGILNRKEPYAS